MPKLLVVFSSIDAYAARMADVVAEGANSVRFTEVDVRAAADADADGSGCRRLMSPDVIRDYDGMILVGPGPESAGHEFGAVVAHLERGEAMPDAVLALAGEQSSELIMTLMRSSGLIVSQPRGADAEDRARKLGERVAEVVAWVRHARGHEAEHANGHFHRRHHAE